jgi:hypothetical protein
MCLAAFIYQKPVLSFLNEIGGESGYLLTQISPSLSSINPMAAQGSKFPALITDEIKIEGRAYGLHAGPHPPI